jgi:outer membrane protein TolC
MKTTSVFFLGVAFCCFAISAFSDETDNVFTLERAVATVLEKSSRMKLADAELEAAERAYISSVRALYPKVRLQAIVNGDLFEAEHFFDDENIGTNLVLDWNFYQNGQLRFRISRARTNLKIAEIKRGQRSDDIALETTALYHGILKKKGALRISEKEHELMEKKLKVVRQRFESGDEEESKAREAESSFFESQLNITRSRQACEMQLMRMRELLELDCIPELVEIPDDIATEVDITTEQCVLTAYDSATPLRIRAKMLKLARKGAKFSKLKRLPHVRFFTGSDFELSDQDRTRDLAFRAGLALSYPLYDAGEVKRDIQTAESGLEQARIQQNISRADAEIEVKQAYWEYINQITLYKIGVERNEQSQKAYRKSMLNFEVGQITQSDLARAGIDRMKSEQTLNDLALDVLLAKQKLLNVVGVNDFDAIKQKTIHEEVAANSEKVNN